jgi:hypothetical protein
MFVKRYRIIIIFSHAFEVKCNKFQVFRIVLAEVVHKSIYIIIQLLSLACPEISERKQAPYIYPVGYISDNGQEIPYNFHIQHVGSSS